MLELPRLAELWQLLAEDRPRYPSQGISRSLGVRRQNLIVAEADEVAGSALADPDGVRALERLASDHPDPEVRENATRVLDPGRVPTFPEGVDDYLRHPRVGLADAELEVLRTVVMNPNHVTHPEYSGADEDRQYEDAQWSWIGGEPSGPLPAWPRRADGLPLAHVAQLDLAGITHYPWGPEWAERVSLPITGVLQVFHDLETYGGEPSDGDVGAWVVRYVERPSRRVPPPAELEADARRPITLASVDIQLSFPLAGDLPDLTDEHANRLSDLQEGWLAERNTVEDMGPRRPGPGYPDQKVTHWLGYSSCHRHVALETLDRVLPLTSTADEWVLLLEAPGVGPLDGWFHDVGSLEMWMRRSDLRHGAYDHAWALIRTD